jgi:MFS family permease
MSDADPYNWSYKKKVTNLFLVAFHAMMAMFTAAAILTAFVNIAEDLGIEVQTASYLTSLVIAILGAAPLIWRPLSQRYGRRPGQPVLHSIRETTLNLANLFNAVLKSS